MIIFEKRWDPLGFSALGRSLEIIMESWHADPEAEIAVRGSIFMTRTLQDGSLRLLGRLRRARMRWKAEVAYFHLNVMKCYEIPQTVMKITKMLWNVMKTCYEIFHNIFITFWSVWKKSISEVRRSDKNPNYDVIRSICMDFYQKVCIEFSSRASGMLWNPVPRINDRFFDHRSRIPMIS